LKELAYASQLLREIGEVAVQRAKAHRLTAKAVAGCRGTLQWYQPIASWKVKKVEQSTARDE